MMFFHSSKERAAELFNSDVIILYYKHFVKHRDLRTSYFAQLVKLLLYYLISFSNCLFYLYCDIFIFNLFLAFKFV